MKKNLLTICLLIFVYTNSASAQFIGDYDSVLQQKFNFQVKQISQFFDRFNFKEVLDLSSDYTVSRTNNLVSLVNFKDTLLTHNPETVEFLKYVGNDNNNIHIDYSDSNWYAIVHSSFLYKNQTVLIDIILKPEGIARNGYSWVIANVRSTILYSPYNKDRSHVFINPMNHEIGFTELLKALNEKNKITLYTSVSYHFDQLSTFLFLVKNGELILKQISSIDYQFLQVPGWTFVVKDFNRADYNSGWLISSIEKMSDVQKYNYSKNNFTN